MCIRDRTGTNQTIMWKDFFYFTKTERQGIIVLVVLIIGVFSIPRLVQLFSTPQEVTPEEDEKFKLEYDEFISSIKEIKPQRKFAEGDLSLIHIFVKLLPTKVIRIYGTLRDVPLVHNYAPTSSRTRILGRV